MRIPAEVVRRETCQPDWLALPGALANQPLAGGEGGGRLPACLQAVSGGPLEPGRFVIKHIQCPGTSTEEGHEARNKALSELRHRVRTLEFCDDAGGARLDPSLLVYRGGTVLEHLDGSGETAGFVGGVGKRNRLRVVPGGDRLDRALER